MSLQQLLNKFTYFTECEEQYCLSVQNPVSDSIRSKMFLDYTPFLQNPFSCILNLTVSSTSALHSTFLESSVCEFTSSSLSKYLVYRVCNPNRTCHLTQIYNADCGFR